MIRRHIFISSVQKEFTQEREALRDYIHADPLLRRFFEVFLFEDLPAADRPADRVYLDEVCNADIYLGLFGNEYGWEDKQGVSPTEREFNAATEAGIPRLIYVKGINDRDKHPKMKALIGRAGNELIRRRFDDVATLKPAFYASLVEYLEEERLISTAPFDASPCLKASLADLDEETMTRFIRQARHFHGTEVAKPIPSYQTYKGTVFRLVDQAIDFVMSKIDAHVGTRSQSAQAPVTYEIPRDVVAEAIVNAVAHRDYTSNASVQVMLFSDRLEVVNPGGLPRGLTLAELRHPHYSIPRNPLIAESLYLTQYIERMGTGTGDMIRLCREVGLPEPEFGIRGGFVTTVWRKSKSEQAFDKKSTGKTTGKTTGKRLGKTAQSIVDLIRKMPDITLPEIAKKLDRSLNAIEKQVQKLKDDEIIARIGPAHGGHWEIIE